MGTDAAQKPLISPEESVALVRAWYHVFVVAALMGYMVGVRVLPLDRFRGTDALRLQAVDSFYHWRATEWTVQNYPRTVEFEPFTGYPTGRFVGQFGTLFDQFIATLAMLIGLGSPSQDDILLAALLGVPLLAALVAIPVYAIGARLGGRLGGLAGVALLALAPSEFLARTTAGMFQHHVAEVLLMALTIWLMLGALQRAGREPVAARLRDRNWRGLVGHGADAGLAGVTLVVYLLVWPPAMVLIGIITVALAVAITIDHGRGRAPDPVAFVGVVSLGTVAMLGVMVADMRVLTTSTTTFSLFQPLLAALGAIGCLGLVWVARVWDARGFARHTYPAGVASIGLLGLALLWLVLPDIVYAIVDNVTGRIVPLGTGVGPTTVAEARPPADPAGFLYEQFGFAAFTMLVGVIVLAMRPLYGRAYRSEHTLLIVWTLVLFSMSLTQIRFHYYLVLPVAVLNAYLVGLAVDWMNLGAIRRMRELDGYQLQAIAVVIMVLFVPVLPPVPGATATDVADRAVPSADGIVWGESTVYLADHTPAPGDWGPHENADELAYFGDYRDPGNGFAYPDGTYGVLAWWDYGHLITTQAQRIPHANPFQQHARSAATFLLADSEARAELVIEAIGANADGVRNVPDEELQMLVDEVDDDRDADMRYVLVDGQTVGQKFSAIAQWGEHDPEQYVDQATFEIAGEHRQLPTWNDAYYDTMGARLYVEDGAGLEHYRLVHETADEYTVVGNVLVGEERRQSVRLNTQLEVGLESWSDVSPTVRALERATDEHQVVELFGEGSNIFVYDAEIQPAVKTFERVEGATITGTTDEAGVEVTLRLQLNATSTERPVLYTQDAAVVDGRFAVTVPYPTTAERGTQDGYTNSSVHAVDSYEVIVQDGSGEPIQTGAVDVPGRAIYDGDELAVELDAVDPEYPRTGP